MRDRAHLLPILALVALLGGAAPGLAMADAVPFDPAPLLACRAAGGAEECVGLAARACIEAEGPASAGLCMGAENAWWLGRIDSALVVLQGREAAVTARARRLGWPEPIPSLEAVTTGFEAYRAAACGWRAAAWDGIHAGVEEMDCLLEFNARHALWLEHRVEGD